MASVLSAKPSTALREVNKNTTRKNKIFVVLMFIASPFSFKISEVCS
jgi:hypothetical protein